MALTTRVKRLERVAGERPAAPCPTCGAPIGWVPSLRFVNRDGVDLKPTCTLCNFPLMSKGRAGSARPPGSVQKRIILSRLPPGMAGVPWR